MNAEDAETLAAIIWGIKERRGEPLTHTQTHTQHTTHTHTHKSGGGRDFLPRLNRKTERDAANSIN